MFVSDAVSITVNCRFNSLTFCKAMFGGVGATFTSLTITWKLLVALKFVGWLLSVTTVVMVLVLGLCVWAGDHAMMPLVLIPAPFGGETN